MPNLPHFGETRRAALYALWLAERDGVRLPAACHRVTHDVYTGTVFFAGPDEARVDLPHASAAFRAEWDARCAAVLPPNPRTKPRKTVKVLGITIEKKWDWTKDYADHVRHDFRRLFTKSRALSRNMTKLPAEHGMNDGRLAP